MEGTLTKTTISYSEGNRPVHGFTMTFEEVEEHIPRRLAEDFAKMLESNRVMDGKRVNELEKYMTETPEWVLQPITLAIGEEGAKFSANGNGTGKLKIEYDDSNPLRIIDGQHRRQAIHQLLDKEGATGTPQSEKRWKGQEIGVTLFVESIPKKLRQMFADMAETKAIDRATRTRFNTGDPFNNIALSVEVESQLVKGRIDTVKPTTQVNRAENLLTGIELKDVVSILLTGKTMSKPTQQMSLEFRTDEKEQESVEHCIEFLDSFTPKLHEDFGGIRDGNISPTELALKRQNNLLLYPQVIMFAAYCYWAADGDAKSIEALLSHLVKQNFDKDTHVRPDGHGFLKENELVNAERTNASKVTLLGKTRAEWANKARETLRNAKAESQD